MDPSKRYPIRIVNLYGGRVDGTLPNNSSSRNINPWSPKWPDIFGLENDCASKVDGHLDGIVMISANEYQHLRDNYPSAYAMLLPVSSDVYVDSESHDGSRPSYRGGSDILRRHLQFRGAEEFIECLSKPTPSGIHSFAITSEPITRLFWQSRTSRELNTTFLPKFDLSKTEVDQTHQSEEHQEGDPSSDEDDESYQEAVLTPTSDGEGDWENVPPVSNEDKGKGKEKETSPDNKKEEPVSKPSSACHSVSPIRRRKVGSRGRQRERLHHDSYSQSAYGYPPIAGPSGSGRGHAHGYGKGWDRQSWHGYGHRHGWHHGRRDRRHDKRQEAVLATRPQEQAEIATVAPVHDSSEQWSTEGLPGATPDLQEPTEQKQGIEAQQSESKAHDLPRDPGAGTNEESPSDEKRKEIAQQDEQGSFYAAFQKEIQRLTEEQEKLRLQVQQLSQASHSQQHDGKLQQHENAEPQANGILATTEPPVAPEAPENATPAEPEAPTPGNGPPGDVLPPSLGNFLRSVGHYTSEVKRWLPEPASERITAFQNNLQRHIPPQPVRLPLRGENSQVVASQDGARASAEAGHGSTSLPQTVTQSASTLIGALEPHMVNLSEVLLHNAQHARQMAAQIRVVDERAALMVTQGIMALGADIERKTKAFVEGVGEVGREVMSNDRSEQTCQNDGRLEGRSGDNEKDATQGEQVSEEPEGEMSAQAEKAEDAKPHPMSEAEHAAQSSCTGSRAPPSISQAFTCERLPEAKPEDAEQHSGSEAGLVEDSACAESNASPSISAAFSCERSQASHHVPNEPNDRPPIRLQKRTQRNQLYVMDLFEVTEQQLADAFKESGFVFNRMGVIGERIAWVEFGSEYACYAAWQAMHGKFIGTRQIISTGASDSPHQKDASSAPQKVGYGAEQTAKHCLRLTQSTSNILNALSSQNLARAGAVEHQTSAQTAPPSYHQAGSSSFASEELPMRYVEPQIAQSAPPSGTGAFQKDAPAALPAQRSHASLKSNSSYCTADGRETNMGDKAHSSHQSVQHSPHAVEPKETLRRMPSRYKSIREARRTWEQRQQDLHDRRQRNPAPSSEAKPLPHTPANQTVQEREPRRYAQRHSLAGQPAPNSIQHEGYGGLRVFSRDDPYRYSSVELPSQSLRREFGPSSASVMGLPPKPRAQSKTRSKIEACVAQLKALGYGQDNDRLMYYAEHSKGSIEDAIDMVEEERDVINRLGQA